MTKTNTETGKKNWSFWLADVKNIITARSYKLNMKESYENPNPICSIQLMLMQKKN